MIRFESEINKAFKPLRAMQIVAALLFTTNAFIRFLLLISIQKTIDSISVEISYTQKYLNYCIIMVVLFFGINCIFQYLYRRLEYTSHYSLIKSLFYLVLGKDYSFHGKFVSSALLTMIKDDSKFISDWKSIGIMTVFINIVNLILAFGVMFYYSIFATIAIFLIIILCFVSTHFISKAISNRTYKLQFSNIEASKMIVEHINGIKDIKQYKREKFFKNRLSNFIDNNPFRYSKSIALFYSAFTSIYAMLAIALPIIALLIGIELILNNRLTIGELIALYAVVGTLQEPVQVIPDYLNKRRQALAMQDKIMPILLKKEETYTIATLGALESFDFHSDCYQFDGGKHILKNVSFSIKKGSVTIVKGESGKGKSSLLSIISRFYNINNQSIIMKYNGIPIETIVPHVYYNHVIQSPQEAYIFSDTILNNITLGEKFTDEEISEVIHTVCLDEVIDSDGFNYLLEQNGENISGGQKQRIGLARVLLRKPDLLLLDEPTSALNPELVSCITENIVRFCSRYKIALLLVSHNDSFERYYKEVKADNVQVISI